LNQNKIVSVEIKDNFNEDFLENKNNFTIAKASVEINN
jgi:hypothetical protein